MTRTRIIRATMVAWIAGWLALGYGSMLASIPPAGAAAAHPTATPWGSIGDPVTGTQQPRHTHKPPKEPRLTMPPTDTED